MVPEIPDYRADRSESIEGRGLAAARRAAFRYTLDDDVLAEAFPSGRATIEAFTELVRDDIAADAREESELIGFWVAWHLAGGFANLERSGWHRATVFRKVKAFRNRFGAHPDDYRFSWIRLDLHKAWQEQVEYRLATARGQLGD
jgi:hypothetical protein